MGPQMSYGDRFVTSSNEFRFLYLFSRVDKGPGKLKYQYKITYYNLFDLATEVLAIRACSLNALSLFDGINEFKNANVLHLEGILFFRV